MFSLLLKELIFDFYMQNSFFIDETNYSISHSTLSHSVRVLLHFQM